MTVGQVASAVLLAAGVAVVVASAVAALRFPDPLDRLHYLSPVTSVGAPLIGLSLAVANGWGLTTGQILVTTVILAITGPALASATARLAAEQEGLIPGDRPE